MKSAEELGEISKEFEVLGVNLELGKGYLDRLTGFEVVFKTPIPTTATFFPFINSLNSLKSLFILWPPKFLPILIMVLYKLYPISF